MTAWQATGNDARRAPIPAFVSVPISALTRSLASAFSSAPLKTPRLLAAITLAAAGLTVQAATITVNSLGDDLNPGGACTLRGAVGAVNGAADANGCTASGTYGTSDTIVFADTLAGQTVQFTAGNGQIAIGKPLTIRGPAIAATDPARRVTLRGGGSGSNFRLLDVANNASPLTVEDLDFIDGNKTGGSFTGAGAAIRSDSSAVTVRRCRFENNHAGAGGGAIEASESSVTVERGEFADNGSSFGGAIDTNGTVTVADSTFSGNMARELGGAIHAGNATVANSTFSGNRAGDWGGAIYTTALAAVANSTFSGNGAVNQGGAIGGNHFIGRHLTLVNNIALAGAAVYAWNSADLANSLIVGGNANDQCGRPDKVIGSYNLAAKGDPLTDDTSCGSTNAVSIGVAAAITDIVATTLGSHGGPTQTLALPAASPAIGAADPSGATSQMLDFLASPPGWIDATLDQRGSARKAVGSGRDLGAYETNDLELTPATLPDGTVGTAYSAATLSASGGTGPYTYTITGGSLPPGLPLTGNTIGGTPSAAGTFIFTVTAADSASPPLLTGRRYTVTIGAQATSAAPIPLLGPWSLVLLAGLLGTMGGRGRRSG